MADDTPDVDSVRFGTDFGFYTLTRLIPAVLGLVAILVYTRLFDPAAYGRYALAIVFVNVSSTALFGWLEQAVLRFESGSDDVVPTALALLVVVGGVCLVAGSALWLVLAGELGEFRRFYPPVLAAVVGIGCFRVLKVVFQARLEPEQVTVQTTLQSLTKFVSGLALSVLFLGSIVGWLWGHVVGSLVAVVAMLSRLDVDVSVARREVARFLRYGVPMVGWLFGLMVLTFVDRVLIEVLMTTSAVGVYASNYSLVQAGLPLVLSPVIQTVHPIIIDRWDGSNESEIASLLSEYSRYYLILGVGATVFAGVISRPLSTIVLGDSFHPGYVVIPIVGAALFLWNFAMIGHKGLELREATGVMTTGVAIAVVANVGLNYLLIPPYGYVGAAVATLLSSATYAGFAFATSKRTVRWRAPVGTLFRVTVAGSVMTGVGVAVYTLDASTVLLLGTAAASVVVYAGILFVSGEFRETELMRAKRIVGSYI